MHFALLFSGATFKQQAWPKPRELSKLAVCFGRNVFPNFFSKWFCRNRISKHSELLNLNLICSWYARWFTDSAQPTGAILSDFGVLQFSKRWGGLNIYGNMAYVKGWKFYADPFTCPRGGWLAPPLGIFEWAAEGLKQMEDDGSLNVKHEGHGKSW